MGIKPHLGALCLSGLSNISLHCPQAEQPSPNTFTEQRDAGPGSVTAIRAVLGKAAALGQAGWAGGDSSVP